MNPELIRIFDEIPYQEVLQCAKSTLKVEQNLPDFVSLKENGECVTQADLQIQELLIDYFANSALAGSYVLKAEERISEDSRSAISAQIEWQLIIDPLDGTSAYARGESTWGTMIGLCDLQGNLSYSWNLISSGEIYSSSLAKSNAGVENWNSALERKGFLNIDVYDYGAGAAKRFPEALVEASLGECAASYVRVSSCPSAVWAGWELYRGNLDGLLWIASDQGKQTFPDYDLVFLGALKEQGWRIGLGKRGDSFCMVVVAPSQEELNRLCKIGRAISGNSANLCLNLETELKITGAII